MQYMRVKANQGAMKGLAAGGALGDKLGLGRLGDTLGGLGGKLPGGLGDKLDGLGGKLPGGLGDKLGGLGGKLPGGLGGMAGKLPGGLGGMAGKLPGGLGGMAGKLPGGLGGMFLEEGRRKVDGAGLGKKNESSLRNGKQPCSQHDASFISKGEAAWEAKMKKQKAEEKAAAAAKEQAEAWEVAKQKSVQKAKISAEAAKNEIKSLPKPREDLEGATFTAAPVVVKPPKPGAYDPDPATSVTTPDGIIHPAAAPSRENPLVKLKQATLQATEAALAAEGAAADVASPTTSPEKAEQLADLANKNAMKASVAVFRAKHFDAEVDKKLDSGELKPFDPNSPALTEADKLAAARFAEESDMAKRARIAREREEAAAMDEVEVCMILSLASRRKRKWSRRG